MIRSVGMVLLLTAIVITAGLWFQLLAFLASLNVVQIACCSLVLVGWIHLKRSDRRFLEKGSHPTWLFCALDYGLLLLPLMVLFFAFGAGFASLAALSGLIWVAISPGLLHQENHAISQRLLPLLPTKAIEWRFIFRKQGPLLLLVTGFFMATLWHPGFYVGGQLLLLVMLMSSFEFIEPGALLPGTRREAFSRWRQSALILHLIAAPGYLLLIFHGFNYILLALYGLIMNEILLLLCFAWKWAMWHPGRHHLNSNMTLSLAFLFLILPGFAVIPLVQGVYYAQKAIHNLRLS